MDTRPIVVGIDVGGPSKGFHAVALRGGAYFKKTAVPDAPSMAQWCHQINATMIGVDAPCRWSSTGRSRSAERELMAAGIFCFSTPTRQSAEHRDFYRWMVNGAELYSLLETSHRLFDGNDTTLGQTCFETFPQAVACALAGKVVSAKRKCVVRRELLREAGFDTTPLTNIDMVDAALCALTANCLLNGNIKAYGDVTEGFIVVPR